MKAVLRMVLSAAWITLVVSLAPVRPSVLGQEAKKERGSLQRLTVTVGGQQREALVHYPKAAGKGQKDKQAAAPVILVFHGHGHSMKDAAEAFGCHKHWEEAISVYLQGLNTPTPNDPKGKHPGWDIVGKRDYLFFDAVLVELAKQQAIDDQRIFAAGFSNGAYFAYGLWANRGSRLRAIAPCAGTLERIGLDEQKLLKKLAPKPCLHIAGKRDKRCLFDKQHEAIKLVCRVNACRGEGEDWPKHKSPLDGKLYPSEKQAPTSFLVHEGGHTVPDVAGKLIVEFFKQVTKK